MFVNFIKKHFKVIILFVISLIIFAIRPFVSLYVLIWICTSALAIFSIIKMIINTPPEDRKLISITLLILFIVSLLIYYNIDSFEDIIALSFTLIVDIIITELFDIKENAIKAKIEVCGYKNKFNESYFSLYYNYKKTIIRTFIFSFGLFVIIFNAIKKKTPLNFNSLSDVFLLTVLVFGFSVLISVLFIEKIINHKNKNLIFSVRKHRKEFLDVDEEIQHYLGEYKKEESDILEGKYNYHANIREIRERIYVLINKEAYEKNNNKPNAIKELDNILGKSEYNDSYDKIIEYLEKIRKKIEKSQNPKEDIESINRCIKELNVLKKEKNNVRTVS